MSIKKNRLIIIKRFSEYLFKSSLLDDTQFLETFSQFFYSIIHLFDRMGGHQRYTHQCILWSTCRWNNGVDEDTFVKSQLRYYKCLLCITHIERNDRRFCLTDFEACIAELLQGIVGDVPQTLDAFRFGLDDVKRLAGCSRSSRRTTCLEYIGTGIVAQPIDYRLVSGHKTTDGSQRLAECTHNQVYIFGNTEMVAHTTA